MWMLQSPPSDSNNIVVYEQTPNITPELIIEPDSKTHSYLQDLKDIVFAEIIERIEQKMDVNAADILDAARVRLGQLRADSRISMLLLKPICLLFVFELYLEVQVNI